MKTFGAFALGFVLALIVAGGTRYASVAQQAYRQGKAAGRLATIDEAVTMGNARWANTREDARGVQMDRAKEFLATFEV